MPISASRVTGVPTTDPPIVNVSFHEAVPDVSAVPIPEASAEKDIPTWPSVTEIEANVETLVDGYLVVSEEEPESVKIKLAVVKPVAVRLVVAHGHPGSAERHEKRPSVT
jgi:hypothetical protein